MNDRKINAGVGIPSILLIFVIMCLMTFSILSLVTVRADKRLTERNAEKSAEYYHADGISQKMLSYADTIILQALKSTEKETVGKSYTENERNNIMIKNIKKSVDGKEISFTQSGNEFCLCWSVPVNASQAIEMKISPQYNDESRYKTLSHRLVQTKEWKGENQHLDVYKG